MDDWPAVAPEDWGQLVDRFLDSCTELPELLGDDLDIQRPVFEDVSVGSMLVSHTTHNA